MKKRISTSLLVLAVLPVYSSVDTLRAKSKISDVTVFFSGAQVTRNVEVKLTKGKHVLILDKLPQEIKSQSIQVSGVKGCKILSVKHEQVHKNENKKTADETALENLIEAQEYSIREIRNKLNVFELEEKLLLDNSLLGKREDGSSVASIREAADFYRLRLNEIRQGKLQLEKEVKAHTEKIQELFRNLNELTVRKRITYSEILVTLDAERELSDDMRLSYYIASAGWEPLYDFRVDDISKPLVIVYNANVYQSSGEDWNNVNIRLSTNNPSLSGEKPKLETWYLGRKVASQAEPRMKGAGGIKGSVLDVDKNEGLPFAGVTVTKGNEAVISTYTDLDGQYVIKPVGAGTYEVKTSYVGFYPTVAKNVQVSQDKMTIQNFHLKSNGVELKEVAVTDYKVPLLDYGSKGTSKTITMEDIQPASSRDINSIAAQTAGVYQRDDLNIRGSYVDATSYYADGIGGRSLETTNYISNSLKTRVANLEYTIDIPYTILSDGEDYSLKIKEASVGVNYIYHAVPKLDPDAFLTAEITGWNELNLLSGKSSIYYQGTFTGNSLIDANLASDTLSISLGRDKNIIVKRDGNKEMSDKRTIGGSIKETIGWDLTVKNNKSGKIKITVEDQFPVSERKSMEVEQLESSNATVDERTGKLTWEMQLDPGEKKVVSYKYMVKYPKYVYLSME